MSYRFLMIAACAGLLAGSPADAARQAGTSMDSPPGPAATARFSYRRMYELLQQFHDLPDADTDRLRFAIRLRNENETIPGDLAVHVEFGSRHVEVPVDRFGILDLPISPQLASVNAPVVTNQPADSLVMGLAIIIRRPPQADGLDVDWLREGVRQVNTAMQERARVAPAFIPQAIGVTLKFAGDTKGRVMLSGDAGEISYRADEYNTVDIPLEEGSVPDTIRVTDQPLVIFPLFRE